MCRRGLQRHKLPVYSGVKIWLECCCLKIGLIGTSYKSSLLMQLITWRFRLSEEDIRQAPWQWSLRKGSSYSSSSTKMICHELQFPAPRPLGLRDRCLIQIHVSQEVIVISDSACSWRVSWPLFRVRVTHFCMQLSEVISVANDAFSWCRELVRRPFCGRT